MSTLDRVAPRMVRSKTICIRIHDYDWATLSKIAKKHSLSITQVVEAALFRVFEEEKNAKN